jgi:hypothetical protein
MTRPPLRDGALCIATQALRAWLVSVCPSGTKAVRPSGGLGGSARPPLFRGDMSSFFGDGTFHPEHHECENYADHGKDQETVKIGKR